MGVFALVIGMGVAWGGRCDGLDVRGALTCSSVIQDHLSEQDPNRISGPYVCPLEHLQSGGEHVYSFTCQQNGPVHLLLEDLTCDLDIYILDESCDTRSGCVGESVAGSNTSDEVTFSCRAGHTYTVVIEGFGFQDQATGSCSGSVPYTLRFDVSDETGGCKEICDDGLDNDQDGLIDCDDEDCVGEAGCQSPEPIIDTSRLPRSCLVGQPCSGSASADKGELLVIGESGRRLGDGPVSGVSAQIVYTEPGEQSWTVHVLDAAGESLVGVTHTIMVEPALVLSAPEVLDFGTVKAGTGTFQEGHCQVLDLSGSQGLAENVFSLTYAPPDDGCSAEPVFRAGRPDRPKPGWLPLSGYALTEGQELCLMVPFCAGEVVESASLTITPQDSRFADQEATITVRWEVEGRSWLACNAWWLVIVALVLFVLWVIMGFVRPARFPAEVTIATAGSEKGLRRAAPQPIREIRGARSGFYRDAQVGVHADGSVNGRTRGALFRIRAHRRHGLVLLSGPIETLDRRSRRWSTPEDLATGHVPGGSSTYRAGDLWFRIEL